MHSSTNRIRQLRNSRNRTRNRNTATPTNQQTGHREAIVFTPKLKYQHSKVNCHGVLVLTKRKHALPTEEEKLAKKEAKRQKKLSVATKHVELARIQHKVVSMWEHGVFTDQ